MDVVFKNAFRFLFASVFLLGVVESANAQTTVQLPTVQNFGISTTVVVPDRGRTYAGGVNRSYRSSSRRGMPFLPPSSRGYGAGTSSSGVSVSAHIHDFEEMDRTLLEQAARNRGGRSGSSSRNSHSYAANSQSHQPQLDHRLPRVSDIRRQMAAVRAEKLAQMKSEIKVGLRRERAGDLAGAQAKYRSAMKYASPSAQKKITARIEKLDTVLASRSISSPTKR